MSLLQIPLTSIHLGTGNPRQSISPASVKELAADIQAHGLLQPVVVRELVTPFPEEGSGPQYGLVVGHRRYHAAQQLGLGFIPATLVDLNEAESLEVAISENEARLALAPLEVATAYKRLHEDHDVSVDDIAARSGKSKASIYNLLKLTELVEPAKVLLRAGKLNASTAQLVARIPDAAKQEKAARTIAEGHGTGEPLSYREALDILPKDAGVEQKPAADPVDREERAKAKARHKRALAVTDRAVAEMVSKVQVLEPNRRFWALLASAIDGQNAPETIRRRLGPQADEELAIEEEKRYLAALPKADEGILRAFVFEAVLEAKFFPVEDKPTKELRAAADFFKVDLRAVEAEVKAAEKAEAAK